MIIVNGVPFDISTITNEYPADSIEAQLLHMMSTGTEKYQYQSLNELKLDLQLRKEIVNAAIALNNSDFSFAGFDKSRCNPIYWERTSEGGFLLKEDAIPSDAIDDIFINSDKYATECSTAIVIIYCKALLDVLGEEKFNKQLPKIYLMDWKSEPILEDVIVVGNVDTLLIGDGGYFKNPDFNPETPEWQGENVIALPDSMYYGHGIGIGTADEIISELNKNRKSDAEHSAYLMERVNRLNVKKIADMYYGHSRLADSAIDALVWKPFPETIFRG